MFNYEGTSYDSIAKPVEGAKAESLTFYYYSGSTNSCVYAFAIADAQASPTFAKAYSTWHTYYYFLSILISFGLATLIFKMVPPLCLPYRKTLGKLAMSLGVTDKDHKPLARRKLLVRFLVPFIAMAGLYTGLNFVVSSFLIFLLAALGISLVSFIAASSSEKHKALHDYLVGSEVVDLKQSTLDIEN